MLSGEDLNKLRWSCRRGMLELDVMLEKFLEQSVTSLSESQQKVFVALLELPDPELFSALMGYQILPQADLAELVTRIRADNSISDG